jgi:hypothetical protein
MASIHHNLAPMTRRATTLLALVCALWLGAPAVAAAASDTPQAAIADCNATGKLNAQYSTETLRAALAQMPADVKEYTDCYDVIERQLFAQLGQTQPGTTTATSNSSSSFLPTWLIVVIVLLALAAVTFGALAIRRRSAEPEGAQAGAGEPGGPGEPETGAQSQAEAPTLVDETGESGEAGGSAGPDAPTRVDEPSESGQAGGSADPDAPTRVDEPGDSGTADGPSGPTAN